MPDKEQAKPELSLFQKILRALSYTVDDNGYPRPDLDSPVVSDRDRVEALEALIASERAEAAKEELGLIAWDDNLSDELKDDLYEKYTKARLVHLTPTEGDK